MATETKKVPKKGQNAKTPKMQKLKIDPCSSPIPPQHKKLHKKCKKNHSMQRKAGLSENQPKKGQKCNFCKTLSLPDFETLGGNSTNIEPKSCVGWSFGIFFVSGGDLRTVVIWDRSFQGSRPMELQTQTWRDCLASCRSLFHHYFHRQWNYQHRTND